MRFIRSLNLSAIALSAVPSIFGRQPSWRRREDVEWATLNWVDWFNHRRLPEPIGNIPPAEAEAAYYSQIPEFAIASDSHQRASGKAGAVQNLCLGAAPPVRQGFRVAGCVCSPRFHPAHCGRVGLTSRVDVCVTGPASFQVENSSPASGGAFWPRQRKERVVAAGTAARFISGFVRAPGANPGRQSGKDRSR